MIHDKVILTDADGVLFDWLYAFDQWMIRHGYTLTSKEEYKISKRFDIEYMESKRLIRMFNESAWIRKLPPHKDAIKYVKKLHEEHGYVFHCISSLSNDDYSQHLRTKNLREMFGDTVFERYIYLDTGADKDEVLEKYRDTGCYWVEDKPSNANLGDDIGLTSLLMGHNHNKHKELNDRVVRVNNWKEVYNKIVGIY
jgi:FMN phosphatase YigB (HAD superfamily)